MTMTVHRDAAAKGATRGKRQPRHAAPVHRSQVAPAALATAKALLRAGERLVIVSPTEIRTRYER